MTDTKIPQAVDVIVLGGGLAGHCAALAAAEAGAKVVILEKMDKPGGSTLMSAGSFALAGTDLQKQIGIEDTPEGLAAELMKVSGNLADPKLIDIYVQNQIDAYEWLKRQGVVFHKVSLSSSTSVPRTHPTNSPQLIAALHAKVLETPGISYLPHAAAKRLLTDAQQDRVLGVEVESGGVTSEIKARSGVVIATGGFTRSRSFIEKYAPELKHAPAWGGVGNTGDGLEMACALGAELLDMGYVTGTFGVAINHYPDMGTREGDPLLLRMAMYRGGIAVNLNAERFADESLSYKKLASYCLQQPKAVAFQIFDQRVMDQSAPNPAVNDFRGAQEKGVVKQADTLKELAQLIGIDGARLEATVARYNGFVDAGVDADFGRATLGGGFGKPVRLDTAPFYALPCSAAVLSTYAGLKVDEQMRVMRASGKPVSNLFAAGEVVGGFHGSGYMSGSSLGKAAIFGRIAGRLAATGA